MSDIVEFILARLKEKEEHAWKFHNIHDCEAARLIPFPCTCGYEKNALAEVKAQRQIIEHLQCELDKADAPWWLYQIIDPVFQMLALRYDTHPDYQQEWTP